MPIYVNMVCVCVHCTTIAINDKRGNGFEKEKERIMGEVGSMEEGGNCAIIF